MSNSPVTPTSTRPAALHFAISPDISDTEANSTAQSSSSFLPEMPQWKKDLIQRRKTNVARTLSATSPASNIGSTALLSPRLPTGLAAFQQVLNFSVSSESTTASNVNATSSHQKQAKTTLTSIETTATTILPTKEKSEKFFIGGHYTPQVAAGVAAPVAAAFASTVEESTNNRSKVDKVKESYSTAAEQRISEVASSVTSLSSSLSSSAAAAAVEAAVNVLLPPIPKQRSTTTTISARKQYSNSHNTATIATTKEQQENLNQTNVREITTATTTLEQRDHECESVAQTYLAKTATTEHDAHAGNEEINETYESVIAGDVNAAVVAVGNAVKTNTNTTSTGAKPEPKFLIQSYTKCETEYVGTASSVALTSSQVNTTNVLCTSAQQQHYHQSESPTFNAANVRLLDKNSRTKISQKLQNNQFIKNQQQNYILPKHSKYKQTEAAVQSSNKNSKMVAVHETKKTSTNTQNSAHHHQNHHHANVKRLLGTGSIIASGNNANTNISADFDTGEDLSYGPGIVSKLRCRYLSLALRESMEQQNKQQLLRRSTSLNTLLDRDDVDDDDDDVDVAAANVVAVEDDVLDVNDAFEGSGDVELRKQCALQQKCATRTATAPIYVKRTATGQAASIQKYIGSAITAQSPDVVCVSKSTTTSEVIEYSNNNSTATRSRHLKRGNEVMKRARSVEALLCDKSHWQCSTNSKIIVASARSSYNQGVTATCVTIEDKIYNARERLHNGTDAFPPKRLTSVIDDTERPPPDLVKQTLKKFEASANRRPRVTQRSSGGSDVASKVASYKSFIKVNNKSALVFPKPSKGSSGGSPTKKPLATPTTPRLNANVLHKTALTSNGESENNIVAMTPQQKLNAGPLDFSTPLADASNNYMPRRALQQHQHQQQYDSPVIAISKIFAQLHLDDDKDSFQDSIMSGKQTDITPTTAYIGPVGDSKTTDTNVPNNKSQSSEPLATDAIADSNADIAVSAQNNINVIVSDDNEKSVGVDDVDDDGNNNRKDDVGVDDNDDEQHEVMIAADDENDDKDAIRMLTTGSGKARAAAGKDDKPASTSPSHNVAEQAIASGVTSREIGAVERITKCAVENIAKAGTTQEFKFLQQNQNTSNSNNQQQQQQQIATKWTNGINVGESKKIDIAETTVTTAAPTTTTSTNISLTKQVGVIRPLINNLAAAVVTGTTATAAQSPTSLTSREIEKNRINEMKKTIALLNSGVLDALPPSAGSSNSSNLEATSSLDTVILKQATGNNNNVNNSTTELDDAATNSPPIWALRKRRQGGDATALTAAAPENNSMVFNFSKSTKEVPDYIESDVVIFRRKRELPKPNESGFVLLGDLAVETSTDSDCDDFSMCPPSPCNVEFENANIVIDGKSSMRQKTKESSFRVQFNDTLTSTFEYPSEASLTLDELPSYANNYGNADDLVKDFENLMLNDQRYHNQQQHHHVAVDEIIQLPPPATTITTTAAQQTTASTTGTTTANILGNLPLGSASLGLYTPVKGSSIDNYFQLGVTRAPYNSNTSNSGSGSGGNIVGLGDARLIKSDVEKSNEDFDRTESLQCLKPANDELNIVYSQGAQKTDLLY